MARPIRKEERAAAPPSPDEEAALDAAEAMAARFGVSQPRAVASAVISAWIVERTRLALGNIPVGDIAYDLNDSQARGRALRALPAIGDAISHLPADKPLFELDRDQILDVVVACHAVVEEKGAPKPKKTSLDDEIPF